VFKALDFGRLTLNTVFITVTNIFGYMLSCTVIAYAFARLRARGKEVLFLLVLSTMMLPQQVIMIPLFAMYKSIGWIDTFKPLIVPSFFGNAFLIFMLRQFFMTIPKDLDDAAKIDGCGSLGILWHIILPLSKPALATVTIFGFLWHWNEFLYPLIFLTSEKNKTLQLGLAGVLRFVFGDGLGRWDLLMAASTIVILPPILIFVFAQRYFMEGFTMAGLKR
jgi:multiple sugar transport system permease protein